jgi:hypothetical protein
MNEILTQYGFTYTGSCSCDGVYTEKYRNGDYQVRWRKKQGRFRIKQHGNTIVNWTPEIDIENRLKELNVQKTTK